MPGLHARLTSTALPIRVALAATGGPWWLYRSGRTAARRLHGEWAGRLTTEDHMKQRMFTTLAILVLGSVSALWSTGQARQRDYNENNYNDHYGRHQGYRSSNYNRVVIPAGTAMNVRLDTKISTDETQSGETWSGT